MTEPDLDETAVAMLPFVRNDLIAEAPARAQQDVRLRGRAFRQVQLVFDSDLGRQPLGDGMVRNANDQLCQRRRPAEPPARHLGDSVVLRPGGKSAVEQHDASSASHEFIELRRLVGVKRHVGCGQEHAPVSRIECAEVAGDFDVEAMDALERMEQGSRKVRVVVGAAGQQRQER